MGKRVRVVIASGTIWVAVACAPAAPSPPTTPTPTPSPSPSASVVSSAPEGPPPSGYYRYTLRVVADNCTPKLTSFEKKGQMVFARTTSKGLVLNVPILMAPNGVIARRDVHAEPGGTYKNLVKTSPCVTADVRHTLVIKSVSRSLVVLEETSEYLDASTCTPPGPPACTTRVEIRFALEEAKCEAICAATANMTKTPPQFVCKCP
jgi:hypothetical protein